MSDGPPTTVLRYVCERCSLHYAERYSKTLSRWLGLCPRCGAFNDRIIDTDQRSISGVTSISKQEL